MQEFGYNGLFGSAAAKADGESEACLARGMSRHVLALYQETVLTI